VTFVLKEYLKQTAALRKDCKKLFISYVKHHGQVSRDTISRWLKIVMTRGGIDVNFFHLIVYGQQLYPRLVLNLFLLTKWQDCLAQTHLLSFIKKTYRDE
jgi:hypothetical protein